MARPPTQFHWLVTGRGARAIYRAVRGAGCLTEHGWRERRQLIAALKECLARPPSGWAFDPLTGRSYPELGGRTLDDELVDALYPFLNARGRELAETAQPVPPPELKRWWQFWREPSRLPAEGHP